MSTAANVSGSDDQMDIEEDESNQPADQIFQKNPQTMFNRPPPKIFGQQNPMPSNDFTNKDNNRGPNFDDVNNIGNSNMDRENDMNDFRGRGAERDRENRTRGRRDYSNERGSGGGGGGGNNGGSGGRSSNNSRWSDGGRGRSRENDRITPSDGNSRDFNNSRNNMQNWRDSQPNFNNSFMDQTNPRMNMSAGPPPALEDMRLPIPIDSMRGGPMGPNGKFSGKKRTNEKLHCNFDL